MPFLAPPAALRNAVALATAARHVDEPGGKEKFLETTAAMTNDELLTAGMVLARLMGISTPEEVLQNIGLQASGDTLVAL